MPGVWVLLVVIVVCLTQLATTKMQQDTERQRIAAGLDKVGDKMPKRSRSKVAQQGSASAMLEFDE